MEGREFKTKQEENKEPEKTSFKDSKVIQPSPQSYKVKVESIAQARKILNQLSTIKGLGIDRLNLEIVGKAEAIDKIKSCIVDKNNAAKEEPLIALDEDSLALFINELKSNKPNYQGLQNCLEDITTLDLRKCGVNNAMIKVLAGILPYTELKKLNLSNNPISTEGARFLSESIKDNITLVSFYARGNSWGGSKGQRFICDALYQNRSLLDIDIDGYDLTAITKRNKTRKNYFKEKLSEEAKALTSPLQNIIVSYVASDFSVNERKIFINNLMPLIKWEQHSVFPHYYQLFFSNQEEAENFIKEIQKTIDTFKKRRVQYFDVEKERLLSQLIPSMSERIDGVFVVSIIISDYDFIGLSSFKDKWYCKDIFTKLAQISIVPKQQVIEFKKINKDLLPDKLISQILQPLDSFQSAWLTTEYFNKKKAKLLYQELKIKLTKIEKSSTESQIEEFDQLTERINQEMQSLDSSCRYAKALDELQKTIYFRYECVKWSSHRDPQIHFTPK